MIPLKSIIPVIALAICGAPFVQAEAPGPKRDGDRPRPGEKRDREEPRHTTIESVSGDSISIKGAKDAKTFKVTKDTVFTFKGKTVKADEIKPGMRVSVSAGSDPPVAARISADDPPKESDRPGDRKGDGDRKGERDRPKGDGNRKPGAEKEKEKK